MKKNLFILLLFLSLNLIILSDEKKDQKSLKDLNKDIKNISSEINEIKKNQDSILNSMYSLEMKISRAKLKSKKNLINIRKISANIKKTEKEKGLLQKKIDKKKERIKTMLRIIQKSRGPAWFRVFFSMGNIKQLLKNHWYLSHLVSLNSNFLNEMKGDLSLLDKKKMSLKNLLSREKILKKNEEKNLAHLKEKQKEYKVILTKIQNKKAYYLKYIKELKIESDSLESFLKDNDEFYLNSNVSSQYFKGKLIWPIKGKVISRYGKKQSTRFHTYIFNNGIEIKPNKKNTKIKAVYNGKVIFKGYKKGYGNIVVLQHSRHLHTIYGHCKKIIVKNKKLVRKGDFIAISGSTSSLVGESLYFEIRSNLKAQDPLKWLTKR